VEAAVQLVALLAVAAAVSGLSARFGLSSPLVLTGVGLVGSLLPGIPPYQLDPELVLVGVLPPLLYTTAIRTPFVTIRKHRRAITLLSVVLVLVSALAVAVAARLAMPGLPWAAAVALGAVVSPPDAVAATAVARRIGMPRTVVTLLESESLLNDATALVTLRSAVAALGASVTLLEVSGDFVRAVALGAGTGWLVAALATAVRRRVFDPVLDTTLSLLVPYGAYLLAESVHGSGVLGVVVAGLILGHRSPEIQSAASRVTERTIWRTIDFLLESAVFLLIGLQLRRLLQETADGGGLDARVLVLCAAVTGTLIAVRIAWVFPAVYVPRLLPSVRAQPRPPWRNVALIGWAGMRGVVTLAAAFGLPVDVPHRPALVLSAFCVVAATLLVQGSTLPWLVRALGVRGPDPAQDALQQALVLQRAVDAGRARLLEEAERQQEIDGRAPPADVVESLSGWGERIAHAVWERLAMSDPSAETPSHTFRRLRVAMLRAERDVVVEVHRSGAVAAEVLEAVMERLDAEEAMLTAFSAGAADAVSTEELRAPGDGDGCEHLRSELLGAPPATVAVCQDCADLGHTAWVALRMCLRCGHVACCDSSPHRHAEAHFRSVGHPVMRSIELGEAWRWCYVDSELG